MPAAHTPAAWTANGHYPSKLGRVGQSASILRHVGRCVCDVSSSQRLGSPDLYQVDNSMNVALLFQKNLNAELKRVG